VGVIMQAAYRRAPNLSVPAPTDGDHRAPWWWDHVASQAHALRLAGFSAVLLPPVLKTNAGAFPTADGYGPFDDYDIGSKDQFYSIGTRFGTRERLQRCISVMRANGLDAYLDMVPHHRSGGNDFTYAYAGANGAAGKGRFPKHKTCFYPNVPRDPIAGPVGDDFGFGDELAPVNAEPKGYVMNGLVDAGDWLTRSLDVQGYRIDDTKGLAVEFVRHWLESKAMAGKFAVGEYFDGNPQTLNWWVWESGMGGRCNTFDFSLRFMLAGMCSNPSSWDMRQLDHAGLVGTSPANAVTFVENPDTDHSSPIVGNKLLAYAYVLTSEGYPCVFYKDYSTDAGCYALRPWIDNLVWIHENLAFGATVVRQKDFQAIVYERLGHPNLLVGLNNDAADRWRTVTVDTAFGANVQLHDYSGHAGDVWTDGQGRVTIGIPRNRGGLGYVAYSRTGYGKPFEPARVRASQTFEGAPDLDIPPAANGSTITVGRVWCERATRLDARLHAAGAGLVAATALELAIVDPDGSVVESHRRTGATPDPQALSATTRARGWYSLTLAASGIESPGHLSFSLQVIYMASQTLEGS
jgi:alpha-amylase